RELPNTRWEPVGRVQARGPGKLVLPSTTTTPARPLFHFRFPLPFLVSLRSFVALFCLFSLLVALPPLLPNFPRPRSPALSLRPKTSPIGRAHSPDCHTYLHVLIFHDFLHASSRSSPRVLGLGGTAFILL
ncbi:hypothetical protein C8Q79DRAFT_1113154, partial [Trametes meyenii]